MKGEAVLTGDIKEPSILLVSNVQMPTIWREGESCGLIFVHGALQNGVISSSLITSMNSSILAALLRKVKEIVRVLNIVVVCHDGVSAVPLCFRSPLLLAC